MVVSAEITILNSESVKYIDVTQRAPEPLVSVENKLTFSYGNYNKDVGGVPTPTNTFWQKLALDNTIANLGNVGAVGVMATTEAVTPNENGDGGIFDYEKGVPVYVNIGKVWGLFEVLNFIPLFFPVVNQTLKNFSGFNILGNKIDLSSLRNYGGQMGVYIKRNIGNLRIYTDFSQNIYTEIPTEIEYSKNAYSNYEAYKKANIDLLNNQKVDILKLQQGQQRQTQNLDTAVNLGNTLARSAFAMGTGGIASGVGSLIGGAINVASQEIKFNMAQQNAVANSKLENAQKHEIARSTIAPATVTNGSLSLFSAFENDPQFEDGLSTIFYSIDYVKINSFQKEEILRYMFENNIMQKVENIQDLRGNHELEWYSNLYAPKVYQAKITNRNPLNTRKDLIVFCED